MIPIRTPNISDKELYARVQLEAARKGLCDCRERQNSAFDAYMDAMAATMTAQARERAAFTAWLEISRTGAQGWRHENDL